MGVFLNELSALYRAFVKGEEDPLAELEVQYADYAVWQREWVEGEVLREQAEYWKETLAGVPEVLELPADHARPGQQDYAGEFVGLGLGKELTAGLKELSREARDDAAHDVVGGLGGTFVEAIRATGHCDWNTGGQPESCGD